jgi:pyruvate/2-oxoglutarate dehydrogenase complex dihydrolipoamide acyltransferase (E2) component
MKEFGDYEIREFSKIRQALSDFYEVTTGKNAMVGLLELNVNKARQLISEIEDNSGIKLSFTGWLIKCISQAVSEHKEVQAYRMKKDKIIVFDDVHVNTMIERTTSSGKRVPTNHVIISANRKSVAEITKEIRNVQTKSATEKQQIVEGSPESYLKYYSFIPKFIRRWVIRRKINDAMFVIKNAGTVGITAVGMFGKNIAGWPIAFTTHTLNIAVGGIKSKPVIVKGKLEEQELLNLTIQIDHNIVDGAPAARFASKLAELIESAYGLD